MKKRKIAVLTGIRSEYDIFYSALRAISNHPALELQVIATGAHLSETYGRTVREIEKDGFPIVERIESLIDGDSLSSRAKSAAIQMTSLVQTLDRIKPDIILVLGDREEPLVAATVGVYLNIPVAHMCGGDKVLGNVDDTVRHAVTKLAHIHFPITAQSAERILRLGEEPWRVHLVGNAGLDRIVDTETISRDALSARLGFDIRQSPIILLIQHPLSSEVGQAGEQMRITMEAVETLGIKTLVGYPNSDAGGKQMIKVINEFAGKLPFVCPYKNLSRTEFVNLIRIADVMIGNSSSGIIEAPILKLPVVNIGNRQKGREHAGNVLFVKHDKTEIISAIRTALEDEAFKLRVKGCVNPYGDGKTGKRIAEILAGVAMDGALLNKDITY